MGWRLGSRSVAAVVAAVAAGLVAGAARADIIVTATYRGTVTFLFDPYGELGQPTNSFTLSDLSFTDTFVYDLNKTLHAFNPVDGQPAEQLLSGSGFPGATLPVSSTVTLGAVTMDFLGSYVSELSTAQGVGVTSEAWALDGVISTFNSVSISTNAPATVIPAFSGVATSGAGTLGEVILCADMVAGTCNDTRFEAVLDPTSLDISIHDSVPEPASWALMIVGFGLAGAGLRGRRRIAAG